MDFAKMIMFVFAAATIVSMASAISGTATYYASSCYGYQDKGKMVAAANPALFTIVDVCPGCAANQIDLSEQAFKSIADPNAGKIWIEYSPGLNL
ncbi:EG45-like domain containing protein isoform X2 [Salvia splendens]|uniref:EG45-like domain containing protein isoform X2 n=1 Tax=Salvia splendens TaxID=180675 RepID=UPI001C280E01|nr:EG45-like domain containing protein isoform X2 [Salvia splendens]